MTSNPDLAGLPGHIRDIPVRFQLTAALLVTLITGLIAGLLPIDVAIFILAGIGLFILALIQPIIGIAFVLLAGPLAAVESLRIGGILFSSGQLLFILTFCTWIGYGIVRRRIIVPRTPINFYLILFIGLSAITLINTPSLRNGLKEEIKWIEMLLVVLLITDLGMNWYRLREKYVAKLSDKQRGIDIRWIVGILMLAGVSQALIGIWQFGFRGGGPDHFLILDRFYRAFGTFQQPNPFGGFMGLSAAIALGAMVGTIMGLASDIRSGHLPTKQNWFWLGILTTSVVTTGLALIMSWSRGAWLGFGTGLVAMIFFLPKKRWKGIILVLFVLTLSILAFRLNMVPEPISSRLITISEDLQITDVRGEHVTIENFAVIERLAHWQAGLAMARENLFSGVGFGNYEVAYEDYRLLNWDHPLGHAHNYYINIMAETGILGTLAYLLFWAVILLQAINLLNKLDWPERGIALGLLTAWTALAVHHIFDKLYVNNIYLYLGVMLALQQLLQLKHDRANR